MASSMPPMRRWKVPWAFFSHTSIFMILKRLIWRKCSVILLLVSKVHLPVPTFGFKPEKSSPDRGKRYIFPPSVVKIIPVLSYCSPYSSPHITLGNHPYSEQTWWELPISSLQAQCHSSPANSSLPFPQTFALLDQVYMASSAFGSN